MPVCCYGQSSYMYQIRIGAHMLICRDHLRDRVVDEGGWFDSHTGWIKIHLSIIEERFYSWCCLARSFDSAVLDAPHLLGQEER